MDRIPRSVRKTVRRFHNFGDDELDLRDLFPRGNRSPQRGGGNNDNGDDESSSEEMPMMEQVATGSGVIVEASDGIGYIVTNNHVAGGAQKMTITLNDGRRITRAKVVGTDLTGPTPPCGPGSRWSRGTG